MTKRIKKLMEENAQVEDTSPDVTEIDQDDETVDESVGSDSLRPGSRAVDDPKSKFQVIASAIGALAQVDTTSLTKFYDEMMALIGHEADPIASGTSAKNAATIAMKEEFNKLFEGDETFTEDFKKKAFTLFEAAVETRVALNTAEIEDQLAEEYTELLSQEIEAIEEGVSEYLDYAADTWMEDNKLVVENSLRSEITEDFIKGLKDLFEQHYIDIPDESVDIVESLSEKVELLEARLNELISENAELTDIIEQETLNNIVEDTCKGLTLVEQDKLRSLAETISYESREDFASKLQTIKESQVIKGKTSALNEQLEEVNEDNKEEKKIVTSPEMKNYVDAIARSVKTS